MNRIRAALFFVLVGLLLIPENSWNLQGGTVHPKPVPTVTFTWSLSTANPPYYSVAITPMGSVTYKSFPNSDLRTGVPYLLEFTASRAVRTRIFGLAQDLNFFAGRIAHQDNQNPAVISKSFTYQLGVTQHYFVYTSTENRRVRQLASLFEDIDSTVTFRRDLEQSLARNPSGLEPELKELRLHNKRRKLIELQVVVPVLQEISSDARISEPARQDARSILNEPTAR